jgi:phospholipid/cholesterol/gamma-HCH transport system substrate-binding protein
METRASHIAVGTFVLLLLFGLAGFVVWISKFQSTEDLKRYDILFEEAVTGLELDSNVRYRGVPVGRVRDIRIDPSNIERIRVTIEIRGDTPVKVDTKASLELQGLTGGVYVLLNEGTQGAAPLPGTTEAPYPEIGSRRSSLAQIFQGAPELLAKGSLLLDRVTLLFNDENQGAVHDILVNVKTLTDTLATQSGGLGELLTETKGTVGQIGDMSTEIEGLAKDLRTELNSKDGKVNRLVANADKALTDVSTAATSVNSAANEFQTILAENRTGLAEFGSNRLFELTQFLQEARLLVASLSRISKQLERDPARFLLGDRLKGYEPE